MPEISFKSSYNKDTSLVMSPREFKEKYLFGLDLSRYGEQLSDSVFDNALRSAQARIEEFLQLKLVRQVYVEEKHFWNEDWVHWGYIPTQFPVACAYEVSGFLGTVKQTLYPREWISAKKTSDGQYLHRMMYLVPNTKATHNQVITFHGLLPHVNYMANRQIPNYWHIVYATGFEPGKIPSTILQAMGKLAAIDILTIASDGMMPFPGVASTSISLDGLSQNLSSVASGQNGIFGARIAQYTKDLWGDGGKSRTGELYRLYDTYTAILMGTA